MSKFQVGNHVLVDGTDVGLVIHVSEDDGYKVQWVNDDGTLGYVSSFWWEDNELERYIVSPSVYIPYLDAN